LRMKYRPGQCHDACRSSEIAAHSSRRTLPNFCKCHTESQLMICCPAGTSSARLRRLPKEARWVTHAHAHRYELVFGSRGKHHHHSPLRQPPPSQSPPPHHFYHHRRHNHSSKPTASLLTRPHHLAQRTDRGAHRRPRRTSLWSCLMTLTLTIGSLANGLRSASTPTDRPSARQVAPWWPRTTLGQRHRSWCGKSAWRLGTMR
jgi:hypothetical protein